jgi:hypothetical protein
VPSCFGLGQRRGRTVTWTQHERLGESCREGRRRMGYEVPSEVNRWNASVEPGMRRTTPVRKYQTVAAVLHFRKSAAWGTPRSRRLASREAYFSVTTVFWLSLMLIFSS